MILGELWEASFTASPAEALAALVAHAGLTPVTPVVTLGAPPWSIAVQLLAESHIVAWAGQGGAAVSLFSCKPLPLARMAGAPGLVGAWRRFSRGPQPGRAREGARRLYAAPGVHPDRAFDALGLGDAPELAHDFTPHGRSAARAADTGWAVAHTWPEYGLMAIDLGGPVAEVALAPRGWRPLAEAADADDGNHG